MCSSAAYNEIPKTPGNILMEPRGSKKDSLGVN
jgi:hypothetical protein